MRLRHGLVAGAIVGMLLGAGTAAAQAVRPELATLLQEVGRQTGFSLDISGATETSISISHVNGRPVCDLDAREDVEALQLAFDAHPETWRNIGPTLVAVTDADGQRVRSDLAELRRAGVLEGCPDVYISVRE